MNNDLLAFFESPDRENYLAVRKHLISSDDYDPYSDETDKAGELIEQNDLEKARDKLTSSMGNLLLSPNAHQMLGFLHHKLGNEEAAEMELTIAHACILGILDTGDGTKDNPYIVVRSSDEYDVMMYLEKDFGAIVATVNDRHFDWGWCKNHRLSIAVNYVRITDLFESWHVLESVDQCITIGSTQAASASLWYN